MIQIKLKFKIILFFISLFSTSMGYGAFLTNVYQESMYFTFLEKEVPVKYNALKAFISMPNYLLPQMGNYLQKEKLLELKDKKYNADEFPKVKELRDLFIEIETSKISSFTLALMETKKEPQYAITIYNINSSLTLSEIKFWKLLSTKWEPISIKLPDNYHFLLQENLSSKFKQEWMLYESAFEIITPLWFYKKSENGKIYLQLSFGYNKDLFFPEKNLIELKEEIEQIKINYSFDGKNLTIEK